MVTLVNVCYRFLLAVGLGCLCPSAWSAPLVAGDGVPAFTAKDQFRQEFNSTNQLRFLLVATEMAVAKTANHRLAAMGPGFLEKNGAAYLLDIHTMPGVARFFAFPKLRKYPQHIVLVDSASSLARFPTRPGQITVLALNPKGIIQAITYWDPVHNPAGGIFQ